jgi:hypothetical protein
MLIQSVFLLKVFLRVIFFSFFFFLYSPFTYAQEIPAEFKKPVAFIFIKDNADKIVPNGTGFFVSIPDSSKRPIQFVYLVTAKHVIEDPLTKKFYNQIYIRINKRNSTFDTIPLKLIAQNGLNFVFQDNIDLAVIPLAPDNSKYDYEPIPINLLFKTKEEFDTSYVKEGTNVFYSGLFSPYLGYNSNNPIIRFGRVALLPRENIFWDSANAKQNLFLVETTTYGGNSGSPLFSYFSPFQIMGNMIVGNSQIKLAGIIKGYSGEKTPIEYVQASMNLMYTSNIGITAVVPSYLLYQILEGSPLKNIREAILKNIQK